MKPTDDTRKPQQQHKHEHNRTHHKTKQKHNNTHECPNEAEADKDTLAEHTDAEQGWQAERTYSDTKAE